MFEDIESDIKKVSYPVHIRSIPTKGRKSISVIENLPYYCTDEQIEKLLKVLRKTLCCNGNVGKDKSDKTILILQGNHGEKLKQFLEENKIIQSSNILLHSY